MKSGKVWKKNGKKYQYWYQDFTGAFRCLVSQSAKSTLLRLLNWQRKTMNKNGRRYWKNTKKFKSPGMPVIKSQLIRGRF